jgi:hypothetical protein
MHNASFWRRYFQSMFKPHLERTSQVLDQRLLPTFDGIESEATALQEKTGTGTPRRSSINFTAAA